MTLNEIISAALDQKGVTPAARTIDKSAGAFTQYVNEAAMDLADDFKLFRTEPVTLENKSFDTTSLSRYCTKILSVKQDGKSLAFDDGDESGEISVCAEGEVSVAYRYVPNDVSSDSDVPDIPEYLHRLIVLYVVARDRASGDASTQNASGVYFSLYNEQKRKLIKAKPSRLINIF